MKKLILTLALLTTITSTAQAANDYDSAYAVFVTTGGITCFPLLPFLTITDFSIDGKINSTEDLAKRVVEAQDDLTYFLATDGDFQNARIDNVLKSVRDALRDFDGSDMDLAMGLIVPQK